MYVDLNSEAEVERALKLDKDYMGKLAGTKILFGVCESVCVCNMALCS